MKKVFLLISILILALAGFLLVHPKANAQDNPVLNETFESQQEIASNGGSIVIQTGGSATFVQGQSSNGIKLINSYVRFPRSLFNTSEGTIEFYVKSNPNQSAGGYFDVGTLGDTNGNNLGIFQNLSAGNRVFLEYSGGGQVSKVAANLNDDNWHKVQAQWTCDTGNKPDEITIFVDGKRDSASFTRTIATCVNPLSTDEIRIGWTGYYGYSNASFDELKIYNRINPNTKNQSTGNVKVVGRQLLVNNQPYLVKGVGYSPVPIGETNSTTTGKNIYCDSQILNRDVPLLKQLGANTIRVWAEPDCADGTAATNFLNTLASNNIRVIMGFWVDPTVDLGVQTNRDQIKNRFRNYVTRYKDNPAVLIWGLGNENNFFYIKNPGKSALVSEWYTLANEMAQDAYVIEGTNYHPVAIVNLGGYDDIGNVLQASDDFSLPYIDLWALNLFGQLQSLFNNYTTLSIKPALVTEFGTDAYNSLSGQCKEDETQQASFDVARWKEIAANPTITVGGTVFNYSDEWWKDIGANPPPSACSSLQPPLSNSNHNLGGYSISSTIHPDGYVNEEWWGLLAAADNGSNPDILTPRQAFYDFKAIFTVDSDGDGFSDEIEQYIGTNPARACPITEGANDELVDPWPPDINDNGIVQIDDISFASGRFNIGVGDADYSARAEITSQNGVIGIDDIFGFSARFGQTCTAGFASSNFTIAGEVTDSQTKKHIQNLTVTLTSPEDPQATQTYTGDKFYYFLNPPTKNLKIEVSAPGYKKEIKHIKPEPTQKSILLNFELRNK